jgi:CubicO group peptidase (beta-lactamase class C family)
MAWTGPREIITAGLAARAFPAAVIEVGCEAGPLWQEALGRLTFAGDAPPCLIDTIFDLASLTKVVATASLVMRAVDEGRLSIDARVGDLLPRWRGIERASVTVRQLLDHSSGLPAHARLWEHSSGREAFERAIGEMALERPPGSASVYSDLGFILLGFILDDAAARPLREQIAPIEAGVGSLLRYHPSPSVHDRIAPTEDDSWRGRVLRGEVHDENAAALGGEAGHAGLFGTAGALGSFARMVLETFTRPTWLGPPSLMETFAVRSKVPGSSRALGWDTMLPTSSCGPLMSRTAIGHTGFTGTSLWIDREQDLYVVFLTNRVHPTRANDALVALRPALHTAVIQEMRLRPRPL